jgi:hypothetical protein
MQHDLENEDVPTIKKNIDIINKDIDKLKEIATEITKMRKKIAIINREIFELTKMRREIWHK